MQNIPKPFSYPIRLATGGRVGDLVQAKASSVKYFLDKHLCCASHVANVAAGRRAKEGEMMADCEGILVGDGEIPGRLAVCKREFALWAQFSNIQDWSCT